MLDRILGMQSTPDSWSNIILKILYKIIGLKSELSSYKPIAYANCIAKLFTLILYTRASEWCTENNKLPEWQSGFRELGFRGCMDNIFTLKDFTTPVA